MTAQRKVVASAFVTLDGFMVGPDEDITWVLEVFDREMQADLAEDISAGRSDAFVFGRVTYEIFAAYWPHAVAYDEGDDLKPAEGKENPRIIHALNEFPKVVVSTTLRETGWKNTRIIRQWARGRDQEAEAPGRQGHLHPGQCQRHPGAGPRGSHRRVPRLRASGAPR